MDVARWCFLEQPTSDASGTSAEPVEVSATTAAAVTGDRRAYHDAATARRLGKPLDPVSVKPATDTTPAEIVPKEKVLSNRTLRDEARTREAVDRATAELVAENARLKAERTTPPAKAAPVAAQPTTEVAPDPADATKYPAGEYDPKFLRDIAAFSAREAIRNHDTETASRAEADAAAAADHARVSTYIDRVKAHVSTEPEFWSHVTTEVANIKPFGALKEGEPAGPTNIIAEEILSSDVSPALMKALSKPDAQGTPNAELRRLVAGPPSLTSLPAAQRAGEHTRWILREIAKLETQVGSVAATSPAPKTATSAPPPATVLGSRPASPADPIKAAVESGDSRAYRQARREQRLASTRR